MNTQTIPAVRRSVTVNAPADRAFEVFTRSMATWWPPTHHIGATAIAEVVVEPEEGGRWYERGVDGGECDWGRVLDYDPPRRILFAWHLNSEWEFEPDPALASEVEVRFTAQGSGATLVEVEHRGFERHGPAGAEIQKAVDDAGGWGTILDRFRDTVNAG